MDAIAITPIDPETEATLEEGRSAEDASFQEMSPKGKFTPKGLNNLVKATNKLLPLFEQDPSYPEFAEDLQVLPADFMRVLAMFKDAIDDAISNDALDAEVVIEFGNVIDDTGLNSLAGKLGMVAKSKDFKKFLQEEEAETEEPTAESEEMAPLEDEDADALMAGRL